MEISQLPKTKFANGTEAMKSLQDLMAENSLSTEAVERIQVRAAEVQAMLENDGKGEEKEAHPGTVTFQEP